MGRRTAYAYAVAVGAALSLLASHSSVAQAPVQQPAAPAVPAQPAGPAIQGQPGGPGGVGRPGGAAIDQGRASQPVVPQRWREMSPQDRQQLRMNAERWQQMGAEERNTLREQQARRQMRLKREAEAAIRESGLQLEAERRATFERRYIEERQRIDQQLRRELREKRQRELAPVVERLRKEFGQQQGNATSGNSGSASPAVSPKK